MLAIGDAISFVTPDDHVTLRQLEKFLGRGLPRIKLTLGPRPPRAPHTEDGPPHGGSGGHAGTGGRTGHGRSGGPGGHAGPSGRAGYGGHSGQAGRAGQQTWPTAHGQQPRRPGQSNGPAQGPSRAAFAPASSNRRSSPPAPYAARGPQPGRFNRSGGGR
jgi:ATP-dependent RNA helicase RhlE